MSTLAMEYLSTRVPHLNPNALDYTDKMHDKVERMQSIMMDVYRNSAFHDNCSCHYNPTRLACRESFVRFLTDSGQMPEFTEWMNAETCKRVYDFLSSL